MASVQASHHSHGLTVGLLRASGSKSHPGPMEGSLAHHVRRLDLHPADEFNVTLSLPGVNATITSVPAVKERTLRELMAAFSLSLRASAASKDQSFVDAAGDPSGRAIPQASAWVTGGGAIVDGPDLLLLEAMLDIELEESRDWFKRSFEGSQCPAIKDAVLC